MIFYNKQCEGCRGTGRMQVANGSEDFDIVECGCKEEVVTGPELLAFIENIYKKPILTFI